MKSTFASLGLAAALAAASAFAACPYPKAPERIPDGNNATLEEMQAAQKAVKTFDNDIGAYQTCIEKEMNESLAKDGASLSEEQKKERSNIAGQKMNAAADEVKSMADRLNEQIRVWKTKNAKK